MKTCAGGGEGGYGGMRLSESSGYAGGRPNNIFRNGRGIAWSLTVGVVMKCTLNTVIAAGF